MHSSVAESCPLHRSRRTWGAAAVYREPYGRARLPSRTRPSRRTARLARAPRVGKCGSGLVNRGRMGGCVSPTPRHARPAAPTFRPRHGERLLCLRPLLGAALPSWPPPVMGRCACTHRLRAREGRRCTPRAATTRRPSSRPPHCPRHATSRLDAEHDRPHLPMAHDRELPLPNRTRSRHGQTRTNPPSARGHA